MGISNFPPELRNYFQQNNASDKDEINLSNFFEEHPSVREAFVDWSKDHQMLVEYTPRLYKALDVATDIGVGPERIAKNINSLFLKFKYLYSYNNFQYHLPFQSRDSELHLHLPLLKELNSDDLLTVLSIKDSKGNAPLHNSKMRQTLLPFLEKLNSKDLATLLSITDCHGNTLLHDEKTTQKFLPFLEKLNSEDLTKILSIKDFSRGVLPLGYFEVRQILLPVLEKLNSEDLITLLSIMNNYGSTLMHDDDFVKECLPLLKKLNSEDLVVLLSIKDSNGKTPMHKANLVKECLPLLEKLNSEDLVTLLSTQDSHGNISFNFSEVIQILLPLIERQNSKDLVTILSIKDSDGNAPMNSYYRMKMVLPVLEKLNSEDLVTLLSIKDSEGRTPLHNFQVAQILLPLLEKLNSKDLVTLLSIKDSNGSAPIHYSRVAQILLPLLEKLSSENLTKILSLRNNDDNTPLHLCTLTGKSIPLHSLSTHEINSLFSIQNNQGNTLLHTLSIWEFLQKPETSYLLDKLAPSIFLIKNNRGLIAKEETKIRASENWLVKNKYNENVQTISEENYPKEAKQLKTTVDEMWKLFVFGNRENQIPLEYLAIAVNNKTQNMSSEEIKKNLDVMLNRIIVKEAWLGTPGAEDDKGLHEFYSQMLTNFDQINILLKDKNLQEKAGTLIGIAKVQMEGRCAAAYQSEIEQAKMVLDSNLEGSGLEVAFNKLAQKCLIGLIERLVRQNHYNNSHAFSQMLYSVGLAPSLDPLSPISLEDSQAEILKDWNRDYVIQSFRESLKQLDKETLQYWFGEKTPSDFRQDLVEKQGVARAEEQKVVINTKDFLTGKQFDEKLVNKTLEFFQRAKGGELKVITLPTKMQYLSKDVLEKLTDASTSADIEEAKQKYDNELASDRLRMQELNASIEKAKSENQTPTANIIKEKSDLQQKIMRVGMELRTAVTYAKTRVGLLEELGKDLSKREDLAILLEGKKKFDNAISELAEEQEIDFTAGESGLPSLALENTRRLEYAKQFLDNDRGAIEILLTTGVLTK